MNASKYICLNICPPPPLSGITIESLNNDATTFQHQTHFILQLFN